MRRCSPGLGWLLVLATSGCSGEAASPPATETPPGATELAPDPGPDLAAPPSEAIAASPGVAGDPTTACARARPCCAAFVLAIGDDAEAERARIACEQMDRLDEMGEASGEACLAAIDGWRRALELREREIPGACL